MATAELADAVAIQDRIREDPDWFCREILGLTLWSKQREILESVRDNPATAVRSGHGVGKSTSAAAAVLWFLAAYGPEAIVVTTAPTFRQVRDLLWREVRKLYARAGGFFAEGALTETKIDFAPDWYAVGLSTNEPENFSGFHSPHLLFVVDEASGVTQPIFEAAEGILTAAGSRTLLIGNPTQVGGEFYDAFHAQRALYNSIRISAFDSPAFTGEEVPEAVAKALPSQEWVERMRLKYRVPKRSQRGSKTVAVHPVYEVRVLGQFPSQGDRAVVPMSDVETAQAREIDVSDPENTWPVVVSCDPARFGSDQTVIALRRGNQVRIVDVVQGQDTMETTGSILRVAREHDPHPLRGKPVVVVDEVGIGGGIIDRLREVGGFRVIPYNSAAAAAEVNRGEYPNARSELWFEFAEQVLPQLDLDPDEELLADLCSPEYRIDSQGRRVVEPKDDTRKRLKRSPDRADACMMAFCRKVGGANVSVPGEGAFGPSGVSPWSGFGGGGSTWGGIGGGHSGSGWTRSGPAAGNLRRF